MARGRVPGAAQWPRGVSALPLLLLAACLRLLLRCPPVRCPAERARCPLPSTTLLAALHSRALSCTDRARRSFPQVYYIDVLEGDYFFRNGVLISLRLAFWVGLRSAVRCYLLEPGRIAMLSSGTEHWITHLGIL